MTAWILRANLQDQRVLLALLRRRHRTLDRLMSALTHFGDAAVVIPVAVLLALGVVPPLVQAGRTALFALVVSHGFVQILKRTVVRRRPNLPVGIAALCQAPDRFSFPSGHSTASLAVALPLAQALPAPLALPLIGLAALVGFSRCYLGVHYPGDVLVGCLLAVSALLVAGPLPGV